MSDAHAMGHADHAGPRFQDYMRTFYALMVLTVLSYLVYVTLGHGWEALIFIMILAIIKASLVIAVFMHLWIDFRKVYGIMVPVIILCIMSTCIFLVDQVEAFRGEREAKNKSVEIVAPAH
jgi:caa(3)-type oxidase subunit IV